MRAERLGRLLLVQTLDNFNEREFDYSHVFGGIYFLAQLLRGKYLRHQEVVLVGTEASLRQVADAVKKLNFRKVPSCWQKNVQRGIGVLRTPRHHANLRDNKLNLKARYRADRWFPKPLE